MIYFENIPHLVLYKLKYSAHEVGKPGFMTGFRQKVVGHQLWITQIEILKINRHKNNRA